MEYMIGAAGIANALSQYINSLCGNVIKNALLKTIPMNVKGLGPYRQCKINDTFNSHTNKN